MNDESEISQPDSDGTGADSQWGETDGGEPEVEQNNGLDVIR
jgi:hypothetical protein